MTDTKVTNAVDVKRNGWRQGSLLPKPLVDEIKSQSLIPSSAGQITDTDHLIVLSHDCDVANEDFRREPFVELIVARLAAKDGNKLWGKSKRCLQIEVGSLYYEFSIHERFLVPRQLLAECRPSEVFKLTVEDVLSLARWTALRYSRSSFPDEFNERIKPAISALRKEFSKWGHLFTAIYVSVDDAELPKGKDYEIDITATMKSLDHQDPDKFLAAQELMLVMEATINGCTGVKSEDVELLPETEFSVDQLRVMKRFDFDDLSLRADDVLPSD